MARLTPRQRARIRRAQEQREQANVLARTEKERDDAQSLCERHSETAEHLSRELAALTSIPIDAVRTVFERITLRAVIDLHLTAECADVLRWLNAVDKIQRERPVDLATVMVAGGNQQLGEF